MTTRWRIAQFFEVFWWRNYLKKKDQTTYLDWKKSYWRQFLNEVGWLPEPQHAILDAGCGPAGIFMVFQEQAVVALDPLLDQYRRNKLIQPESYPNVRFLCAPLEDCQTSEGYDVIYCLNAINHVAKLEVSIQQLFQLLRPGGKLILSTDAHRSELAKYVFRFFPGDILHPHQHDLQDYSRLLEAVGFQNVQGKILTKGLIFNYVLFQATKSFAKETCGVLPSRR